MATTPACAMAIAVVAAVSPVQADPKQATIRRLVARSAAAKAGLLDGDEIVSVESANLMADQPTVVTVKRAGKQLVFRYLPAGAKRDGFTFVRVAGVADARCSS